MRGKRGEGGGGGGGGGLGEISMSMNGMLSDQASNLQHARLELDKFLISARAVYTSAWQSCHHSRISRHVSGHDAVCKFTERNVLMQSVVIALFSLWRALTAGALYQNLCAKVHACVKDCKIS